MDPEEEANLPEDSDSEDEDFVPGNEKTENLSEEEDDGEPEGKAERKKSQKRNGKGKTAGNRKAKKRKAVNADSEEDSDDEGDQDYVLNERVSKNQDLNEYVEDPEIVAAREKAEKERTDLLWEDFKNSVEKSKAEKKGQKIEEKFVTKVYDFAGEKVTVKEKVKISSEDSETRSSTSSSISTAGSSTSASTDSKPSSSKGSNGVPNGVNQASSSNEPKPPGPRKVRISFLSGDPADIGLVSDKKISAREGLANVLHALHARNKKIGTLEKTKLDWEKYKQDEGLNEELESHNRSKHGYIDKQEFLQRADYRQFELEKAARTKRRRNL